MIARYVLRCFSLLERGGALVLFCYRGQVEEISMQRTRLDDELSVLDYSELVVPPGATTFFIACRP